MSRHEFSGSLQVHMLPAHDRSTGALHMLQSLLCQCVARAACDCSPGALHMLLQVDSQAGEEAQGVEGRGHRVVERVA